MTTINRVIFDSDRAMPVNGVNGRLAERTRNPGQAAPLWFKQRWVSEQRPAGGDYDGCRIYAEIRFDDSCGNGHNSFAITGMVINPRRRDDPVEACGCLHDDIARVFPELAHLIKWHGCSTDSPMHYVANTIFHAGDRDYNGKRAGEVTRSETRLRFNGFPVSFKIGRVLTEWLGAPGQDIPDFETVINAVEHSNNPGEYVFHPKYTFSGCKNCKWHEAPFDTIRDAEEFRDALQLGFEWIEVPVAYSEGKARDFNAARRCGVWPDATDEQLSAEPEELKSALMERLPALIAEMKNDISDAGFSWSAEDFLASEYA